MGRKHMFTQMLAMQSKVEFANFNFCSIFVASKFCHQIMSTIMSTISYKSEANEKTTFWNHFCVNFQVIETNFCQTSDLITVESRVGVW